MKKVVLFFVLMSSSYLCAQTFNFCLDDSKGATFSYKYEGTESDSYDFDEFNRGHATQLVYNLLAKMTMGLEDGRQCYAEAPCKEVIVREGAKVRTEVPALDVCPYLGDAYSFQQKNQKDILNFVKARKAKFNCSDNKTRINFATGVVEEYKPISIIKIEKKDLSYNANYVLSSGDVFEEKIYNKNEVFYTLDKDVALSIKIGGMVCETRSNCVEIVKQGASSEPINVANVCPEALDSQSILTWVTNRKLIINCTDDRTRINFMTGMVEEYKPVSVIKANL